MTMWLEYPPKLELKRSLAHLYHWSCQRLQQIWKLLAPRSTVIELYSLSVIPQRSTIDKLKLTAESQATAYFLRPLLHSDLDISRIARWISTCETIHSNNCVLKASKVFRDTFTGLNVMRLIDVSHNCLVEVQVLRQYVALSYIWGGCCGQFQAYYV